MTTDFSLADRGSLAIITPLTEQATEWVDEFISDETQWFGGGFVVEHRYVDDIVNRLLELGMEVKPISH